MPRIFSTALVRNSLISTPTGIGDMERRDRLPIALKVQADLLVAMSVAKESLELEQARELERIEVEVEVEDFGGLRFFRHGFLAGFAIEEFFRLFKGCGRLAEVIGETADKTAGDPPIDPERIGVDEVTLEKEVLVFIVHLRPDGHLNAARLLREGDDGKFRSIAIGDLRFDRLDHTGRGKGPLL